MTRKEFVADPGRLDAVVAATTGSSRADVQRAIAAGDVRCPVCLSFCVTPRIDAFKVVQEC